MTLRYRLANLERRRDQARQGSCPHGVDIVDVHEPDRPASRCDQCGRLRFKVVMREDESGLPWTGRARPSNETTFHRKDTP